MSIIYIKTKDVQLLVDFIVKEKKIIFYLSFPCITNIANKPQFLSKKRKKKPQLIVFINLDIEKN